MGIKVSAMTYIGQSEFSDILDTETFVHPENSMESLSRKWCSQNMGKGEQFVQPSTPRHFCLDFIFC
jgi:hypothetical protein